MKRYYIFSLFFIVTIQLNPLIRTGPDHFFPTAVVAEKADRWLIKKGNQLVHQMGYIQKQTNQFTKGTPLQTNQFTKGTPLEKAYYQTSFFQDLAECSQERRDGTLNKLLFSICQYPIKRQAIVACIKAGADVDGGSPWYNAFRIATDNDDLALMNFLFGQDADLHKGTPLQSVQSLHAARFLVERGAKVNNLVIDRIARNMVHDSLRKKDWQALRVYLKAVQETQPAEKKCLESSPTSKNDIIVASLKKKKKGQRKKRRRKRKRRRRKKGRK